MYVCLICGDVFKEPVERREKFECMGVWRAILPPACPECGSHGITETDQCRACGGYASTPYLSEYGGYCPEYWKRICITSIAGGKRAINCLKGAGKTEQESERPLIKQQSIDKPIEMAFSGDLLRKLGPRRACRETPRRQEKSGVRMKRSAVWAKFIAAVVLGSCLFLQGGAGIDTVGAAPSHAAVLAASAPAQSANPVAVAPVQSANPAAAAPVQPANPAAAAPVQSSNPTVAPAETSVPVKTPAPKTKPAPVKKPVAKYTQEDVNILARVIYSEARGESKEGQYAVASIVLNRLTSGKFQSSLRAVCLSKNQFAVSSGTNSESLKVAKDVLMNGVRTLPGDVYYFRSGSSKNWSGFVWYATIGGNSFFRK